MIRRILLITLLLVLLLGGVVTVRSLGPAWAMATGYSAKQLCSGVFVSGLPQEFVIEQDIGMAVSMLGPLLPKLNTWVESPGLVRSQLFGVESRAVFRGEQGCVLNPAPGIDPLFTRQRESVVQEPANEADNRLPIGAVEALFDAAFAEPEEGQRQTLAIVIMHRGQLLAERYAAPASPDMPLQGWSMNKSLMATWVGMQVERGVLELGASVREAIGERDAMLAEQVAPELDLSHLLHMESGFKFREFYLPGDDVTRMLFRSSEMWRIAPANGHRRNPGDSFRYSSGDTNLASMLWMRSLGGQNYPDWIQNHFSEPLGLFDVTSEADAAGFQVASSYTYMPARSWALVGQFWLDAYHGRREELSREWMLASVTPRSANQSGNYGRGFWLNTQGDTFDGLPSTAFAATGHNSQYVMVLPEEELVIVRLGLSSRRSVDGFLPFVSGLLELL